MNAETVYRSLESDFRALASHHQRLGKLDAEECLSEAGLAVVEAVPHETDEPLEVLRERALRRFGQRVDAARKRKERDWHRTNVRVDPGAALDAPPLSEALEGLSTAARSLAVTLLELAGTRADARRVLRERGFKSRSLSRAMAELRVRFGGGA